MQEVTKIIRSKPVALADMNQLDSLKESLQDSGLPRFVTKFAWIDGTDVVLYRKD